MNINNSTLIHSKYESVLISATCSYCTNLLEPHACKAFPGGIPPDIWLGKNTHTKPYRGDHGIQFEKLQP